MSLSTADAVTAADSALREINKTSPLPPAVLRQTVVPLRLFRAEAETFATNYPPAKTEDQ